MEKLIESRGQYLEIRSRVFKDMEIIENTCNLFGRNCFKEEYMKYIKALYTLRMAFIFSEDEKEESFGEVFDGLFEKEKELKDLTVKYIEARKEEQRKEAESIAFK